MGICERPEPAFLDALAKAFGFAPPRDHGFDVGRHHPRAARRARRRSSSPWAATSSPPRPTPRSPRPRCAARGSPRTSSTKLNRSTWSPGAQALILPLPRPHRARRAGRRPAVRHRRGLDGHGARVARPPARPRAQHLLSEPAIVARLAAGDAWARRARAPWSWLVGGLRPHPRPHRRTWSPASRTSTRACASRAASRCRNAPRDERSFPTATGKAKFTVHRSADPRARARAGCC